MKWTCDSIECLIHAISERDQKAKIAELAKILYRGFRQLESVDSVMSGGASAAQSDSGHSEKTLFPKTETATGDLPPAA